MKKFTAYHGTGFTFEKFKCPAYFADDLETASFFAERFKNTSAVMSCTLKFENPLIVDLSGQSWGGFQLEDVQMQKNCIRYIAEDDADEEQYLEEAGITINFLVDYAESLGYDGLIAHNCREENDRIGTQYVAFIPENIIK